MIRLGAAAVVVAVALVWAATLAPPPRAPEPVAGAAEAPATGAVDFEAPPEGFLTAVRLLYQEQEPGIDPYVTRVLITDDFVRFDDDRDGGDYVLYDRRTRTVYSVAHGNRMIVQVLHQAVMRPVPEELRLSSRQVALPEAPTIDDHPPVQLVYEANGEECQHAVVVPGLLPGATEALREYEETIAGQSSSSLDRTPAELQTPCFLANNVFAAVDHLREGLPLQTWNKRGERKSLMSYETGFDAPSSLFTLNPDYFVLRLSESI